MTADEILRAYKKGERNFHHAVLVGADLSGADLTEASFYGASMAGVDLSGAALTHVQLKGADLSGASLEQAIVNASDLIAANFSGAILRRADFTGAALARADCTNADLSLANLGNASLAEALFEGANLTGALISSTYFDDVDVSTFCDAKKLKHTSPSHLDARSVMRSHRHPKLKQFMTACGVPPIFTEYMIDCANALSEPILRGLMQSTFISYGGPDEPFARRLYDALKLHGVTAFFFPETARVGERINNEIFRQLQRYDRVILVCSRQSLDRVGVINEIQETLDREARDGGATYLLPIMLDDYVLHDWKAKEPVLAERIGRRVIADFRDPKDRSDVFEPALARVIDSLKVRRVDS